MPQSLRQPLEVQAHPRLGHRSPDEVIDNEHNDSAHDCDEHAVQVETGHTRVAGKLEQVTANKRADYPKDNIEDNARPFAIYDFTGDKAGNQPENDPAED